MKPTPITPDIDTTATESALWAPSGVNLTWTTTVPGLALVFAPLTLATGPVASYNVAMVVLPALAAWATFLLLRRVTGGRWGPLVGGYLFGFSSLMIAHEQGHAHFVSAFPVPVCALERRAFQLTVYDSGGRAIGTDLCSWYAGAGWRAVPRA